MTLLLGWIPVMPGCRHSDGVEIGVRIHRVTGAREHRGLGYGPAIQHSVIEDPSTAEFEVFSCTVDVENEPSMATLRRVRGFVEADASNEKVPFSYTRAST